MSWIAFDQLDTRTLGTRGVRCENARSDLGAIFGSTPETLLLVPARQGNSVLLARCKRMEPARVQPRLQPLPATGFASTGILGLDGDVEYLDDVPETKPWWKRLF